MSSCDTTSNGTLAAHTAAVANQPDCPHGQPGGDIPIPDTLWSPCASCRRLAGWTPDPTHTGQDPT